MLETNNNIIIVDDSEDDLGYLAKVFNGYGIGCRTFLYDEFETIGRPLENVKLAFFDVTLTDAGDDTAKMAVLRDALKSYISKSNKAFVLVFWTRNPEYKERFIDFVNRSEDKEDVPKPICIETIDKIEFLDHDVEIRQRLSDLMNEKIVKCLFSFDTELKAASNQSLNEVLKLIDFPDNWGKNDQFLENIKDVFALIATETFGNKRAKKEPDLAIREAFGPLFLHHLCKQDSTVWADFFDGTNIARVHNFPNTGIAAKLNTIFHLDLSDKGEINARGSVRKIKMGNTNTEEIFKQEVGYSINDWVNTILFKNTKYKGKINELIAVEISAACDYSNQKKRTHQYLLGVIIPTSIYDQLKDAKLGDACFDLPFAFIYGGEECHMFLHFTFLITEEEGKIFSLLSERLFSLKNEVMNMIGSKHANHIARIGINSFR